MDRSNGFKITESKIKKEIYKFEINETIPINNNKINIKNNYRCNISKIEKFDTLVSEIISFELINLDGFFSLEEAIEFSLDFCNLFSLLLALPLSLEYIWLITRDKTKKNSLYFSTVTSEYPFKYSREAFINPKRIFDNNDWYKIFYNFFSGSYHQNFKDIWKKLPSLFSYKGIWIYEFLGYVSILESYCAKYTTKKGKKLNKSTYKELQNTLLTEIDNFSINLGDEYIEVMASFKNGIKGIRNTNLPTFTEKFNFIMNEIDPDIRKILNFTHSEFKILKEIRDTAAHALPIKTKYDYDITYEFQIRNKLLLLLIYLVHRDFGFSPVDFASSLKNTLNNYARGAEINKIHLDKFTGVPFFLVDKNSFNSALKTNRLHIGLEYNATKNTYSFSPLVTELSKEWITRKSHKKNRNLVDYIKENIKHSKNFKIEYLNKAYLEWKSKTVELHGTCVISYS